MRDRSCNHYHAGAKQQTCPFSVFLNTYNEDNDFQSYFKHGGPIAVSSTEVASMTIHCASFCKYQQQWQQQQQPTLLEQRTSAEGQTGSTARVRFTLAERPWLLVTENTIVYTPALFML